jgi:hypothetical protein
LEVIIERVCRTTDLQTLILLINLVVPEKLFEPGFG